MGDKEREREVWEQNQAQVCPSPHRTHMSVLDVLDASEKLLIAVKGGSRKKKQKKQPTNTGGVWILMKSASDTVKKTLSH